MAAEEAAAAAARAEAEAEAQRLADEAAAEAAKPTPAFYINCGGDYYADEERVWEKDRNFSGGRAWAPSKSNGLTDLYYDLRYGDFTYSFDVKNGSYNVGLYFSENYWNRAGGRSFDVSINGATELSNFDVFSEAGGSFNPTARFFPVEVTDGVINIATHGN